MDELNESQSTTSSASPSGSPSHRRPAGDKLMELEGRSFMGRFAPRELLDGIDGYLSLETPEHRDQLLAAIRTRAEQLQEQDKDLPVDGQSEGMLALTSTVLAAYETLLPLFDGDQRRTILFLQHVVGAVARRPFEIAFEALSKREHHPGRHRAGVPQEGPLYGSYYDIKFDRQAATTLEMRVERCFFHDHFTRHDNPLLTTVMCAWDANRMRAVATDDPLAIYSDALQQRFSGEQGPG